eukprot:CAMPEP_0202904682 /NCGR_PEP_ID=MMETSP1392-20130828/30605_1 /ASSEMBLY_ACC=CAM_ASM_000868 /TAXON_ID=225041 /ORGANISM="Chlamydomonas chlamydogama, Strain SAG 11-48b" /LENGTH=55 /DNA_ID=CAMNT_0049592439 /DNA_START=709 /DNA_END=876 /DNA_ORIENTATION=-
MTHVAGTLKVYAADVGHIRMRVVDFVMDERRAEQALVHFHDFTKKDLVDWEGWLW